MTIREKIQYLTALENVLSMIETHIDDCMTIKTDENGEYMQDKNGEYIRVAPDKDNWRYDDYMGMLFVKTEIEKIANKA